MGKLEFWKVPFGLAQAPTYLQQLINEVISGLHFAFSYLDDLLIYSSDLETYLKHIEIVFQCLLKTRLYLKEIKCNFLKRHIQYLGHLISETGIEPLPEKLSSLQDMPAPRNLKEVKQNFRFSWLLWEICTKICWHFMTIDCSYEETWFPMNGHVIVRTRSTYWRNTLLRVLFLNTLTLRNHIYCLQMLVSMLGLVFFNTGLWSHHRRKRKDNLAPHCICEWFISR